MSAIHPESSDAKRRGSLLFEVDACSWPRNLNHSPTSGEDAHSRKKRAEQYWDTAFFHEPLQQMQRGVWWWAVYDELSGAVLGDSTATGIRIPNGKKVRTAAESVARNWLGCEDGRGEP